MSCETSILKFEIKSKVFYVKLIILQNEHELFNIKVFDGDNSWSGRFSKEFAVKFAERVDENEQQYSDSVKKILTGGDSTFVYDFTLVQGDCDAATFSWKRRFEDGVTVVHGSVPVHRDVNIESKDSLIDFLLIQNKELKNTIGQLQNKTEDMNSELEKYRSELEKFINVKTSLETSLYGKFVQLLNTKKRRIRLLEENLQNFDDPTKTSASYVELD